MRSRLGRLALLTLGLAVRLPDARADGSRLVIDNDYLNFWQSPSHREDRDYTHGAEMSFYSPKVPGFASWLVRARDGGLDPNALIEVSVRQQIFTPDWGGSRPHAGWLGASARVRRETWSVQREIGVEFGVTGPPSLAESAQKWFHHQFGFIPPPAWTSQVPFEPAFGVQYRSARQIVAHGTDGAFAIRGGPQWGGQLGTHVTGASAGFTTAFGLRPPAPWRGSLRGVSGLSGFAIAGARLDLVAWDSTLDGTMFHASPSITKKPVVAELEVGLGAGHGSTRLEWRVVKRSAEYVGEGHPHTYSSLALTIAGR